MRLELVELLAGTIGQVLQLGAHGPVALHIFLIEASDSTIDSP